MSTKTGDTRRVRMDLESLAGRVVPSATHFYAVGQDIGGSAIVRVYNEDGSLARTINPYGPGFTGGVRVATGDVNGDGTDDIVVAPGPGGGPEVKVYDGATGTVIRDFFAYAPGFQGGVNVAVGDVNGDGKADIVTGTGIGGGPNVKVFDGGSGGLLDSFFAYESSFRGGVNVAAGDVNGDGKADIVTGTGVGGGPRVQVFDGATGVQIGDFFAYNPGVRSGVTVAAGDLTGTGKADIVTGVGFGGGPNVKVFDGSTHDLVDSFFAYDPGFLGGVSVEVANVNGVNDILVAPGPSTGGFVELFSGTTGIGITEFQPFPSFRGGITTGQGVAPLATPFGATFANPRALASAASSGGSYADTGYDTSNTGFDTSNTGYVYSPDPGSYIPPTPTDPGIVYSPDPGSSTPTDTGSSGDPADSGSCGCGDPGASGDPFDTGNSGDPGASSDPNNTGF
ncbi:MAG: hlyA 3 [Gemmataceae bacterium]|nr:hlyA 3 [Gemmataceae bacterium]